MGGCEEGGLKAQFPMYEKDGLGAMMAVSFGGGRMIGNLPFVLWLSASK